MICDRYMASRFDEYKLISNKFNISIDIEDKVLERVVFAGLYFGLFINDELVVTVPFYPEDPKDFAEYKLNVKKSFVPHGTLKKVALYIDTITQQFYALPQSKQRNYLLDIIFSVRNKVPVNIPYREKETVISFIKEDQQSNESIGVIKKIAKTYTFEPFPIFNRKLLSEKIVNDIIPLAVHLGSGSYIEGKTKKSNRFKKRRFLPSYLPSNLSYLSGIREFPLSKEVIISLNKRKKKKVVMFRDLFVKQSLFIGDPVDLNWFGREFGFWAKNELGIVIRFYSQTNSEKGLSCPINEL